MDSCYDVITFISNSSMLRRLAVTNLADTIKITIKLIKNFKNQ